MDQLKVNNIKKIIITSLTLLTFACFGKVKKSKIDLNAEWVGKTELGYMNLTHKDGKITGKICERQNHDCMVIKDAKLVNNILTFHYVFKKGKKQIRLDVKLQISNDQKALTGNATIVLVHLKVRN